MALFTDKVVKDTPSIDDAGIELSGKRPSRGLTAKVEQIKAVTGVVVTPPPPSVSLSIEERTEFDKYREVVRKSLGTFVAVGLALVSIRDKKLYRESHDSFEAFVLSDWQMSKGHANRQIVAAELVRKLSKLGVKPVSEAQVRPLTRLKPALAEACWTRAVEMGGVDGPVTADLVKQAVVEMSPKREAKPTRKTKKSRKVKPITIKTEFGVVIVTPKKDHTVEDCLRAASVQQLPVLQKAA